jgi:plastocyanin
MKPALSLIAALALAVPGAAQPPAPTIPVQLYSFGFNPSPIVLRAGQPVTMVFANVSGGGHSFKAPAFFAHSRILNGTTMKGEVHVMPHRSMSVTLIPARGTYPAHCSHFLHDQMGMHTTIYVQ